MHVIIYELKEIEKKKRTNKNAKLSPLAGMLASKFFVQNDSLHRLKQ